MSFYSYTGSGVTQSTSDDWKTIVASASGGGSVVRLHEIFLAGEATSSAVQRLRVARPITNGTTATAQTGTLLDPNSAAAAFTVAGALATNAVWTTQPSLASTTTLSDVLVLAYNAFGGEVRWVAPPEAYIVAGPTSSTATGSLSLRGGTGTSAFSGYIITEQR